MLMCSRWFTCQDQALMNTLNYLCDWNPSLWRCVVRYFILFFYLGRTYTCAREIVVPTLIRDVWILEKKAAVVIPLDCSNPASESKVEFTLDFTRSPFYPPKEEVAFKPFLIDERCLSVFFLFLIDF